MQFHRSDSASILLRCYAHEDEEQEGRVGGEPSEVCRGMQSDPTLKPPDLTVDRSLSTWGAALHLFKGNIGPGLLALPLNFRRVGTFDGLLITAVVAVQGIYSMVLLLRIQQSTSSQLVGGAGHPTGEPLSFDDVGGAILGRPGRPLVQLMLASMQLGICSVFISFCATALVALVAISHTTATLCVWAACALLSLVPTLRALVPLSIFGSVAMLVAIATSLTAAASELSHTPPPPPAHPSPSPSVADWGSALAATFYAFEGVGLVLPVRNQHTPSPSPHPPLPLPCCGSAGFERALIATLSAVAAFFALVGCVCAAAFPSIDSASVTAYLAPRAAFYAFVNVLVASAVLLTFPLQLTPASEVVEGALHVHSAARRRVVRQLLVAACALLVVALPNLDLLIAIIGSCANTALAALPCIFHIVLVLRRRRPVDTAARVRRAASLAADALIVVFCLTVMVFGVSSAVVGPSAAPNATRADVAR